MSTATVPTASAALPTSAARRGKIAPVKFAHIVFRTGQPEAMVAWYQTVFEAEVALANPLLTFLTFDEEHHRIAIAGMPGLKPQDRQTAAMEHCAFTYASLGDLIVTYQRLRSAGIEPYWCINHGPNLSFYYRDPDGNQVELQIDVFASHDELNAWYADGDFAANPIGVRFDPDELIRRFEAGEPLPELLRRPRIAPDQVFAQLPAA
jgi:catechol 2,3-dioxygenase-like lactoylglutathione lyase family enzyme